mmetsp:Transcript_30551/g.76473  ORF Transcript_30551/g.76473 Transcript_30551/m.76473 type:complete len:246 (+) Transcript_30551:796-1533(+)
MTWRITSWLACTCTDAVRRKLSTRAVESDAAAAAAAAAAAENASSGAVGDSTLAAAASAANVLAAVAAAARLPLSSEPVLVVPPCVAATPPGPFDAYRVAASPSCDVTGEAARRASASAREYHCRSSVTSWRPSALPPRCALGNSCDLHTLSASIHSQSPGSAPAGKMTGCSVNSTASAGRWGRRYVAAAPSLAALENAALTLTCRCPCVVSSAPVSPPTWIAGRTWSRNPGGNNECPACPHPGC